MTNQAINAFSLVLVGLGGCAAVSTAPTSLPQQTASDRSVGEDALPAAGMDTNSGRQTVQITVSAAASLQPVLLELQPHFEQTYPHVDVYFNWGGSGALQRQIEQGAPVDMFLSASSRQMTALAAQGLLNEDYAIASAFVQNQIALIASADSPLSSFNDLKDLTGHLAVGEFATVPAGHYAEATLNQLVLLETVRPKLVFFNNVRAVLSAVESGYAQAGMVYVTDIQGAKNIKTVAIAPAETHPPINYSVGVLKRSSTPEAAHLFQQYLQSETATDIFRRYGFRVGPTGQT